VPVCVYIYIYIFIYLFIYLRETSLLLNAVHIFTLHFKKRNTQAFPPFFAIMFIFFFVGECYYFDQFMNKLTTFVFTVNSLHSAFFMKSVKKKKIFLLTTYLFGSLKLQNKYFFITKRHLFL
jgi:hypothetical protein